MSFSEGAGEKKGGGVSTKKTVGEKLLQVANALWCIIFVKIILCDVWRFGDGWRWV